MVEEEEEEDQEKPLLSELTSQTDIHTLSTSLSSDDTDCNDNDNSTNKPISPSSHLPLPLPHTDTLSFFILSNQVGTPWHSVPDDIIIST